MIHMIYASTSGNVELVMETISDVLQSKGLHTTLSRAERTAPEVITLNDTFILGTSTWEHGKLNPFFAKMYEAMKTIGCRGKQAAFVGLGDRRYEPVLFCEGMEQVRRLWLHQGGKEIGERLRIQGEPYGQLEKIVKPWAEGIVQQMRNHV